MDSVNLASEGNCNESINRIKALGGVAERIGCTLNQVRYENVPVKWTMSPNVTWGGSRGGGLNFNFRKLMNILSLIKST